jgi:mannose-6-phosphate isomerase
VSAPPIPIIFDPIFKAKPWGGRELARLFDKPLPADVPIGESWELADLPGNESRVARGPLAGRKLGELVEMWGPSLLGDAELVGGRFPLLIKCLDARERLSIQVHPRQRAEASGLEPAGVKHEAWYVIDSDPGAALYLGLKPGVRPEDVHAAGSTSALADLLQAHTGHPGQCYYLPSGLPHALGAGLVVAEVQTPSDVTYRLYDWDRLGLDGQPRALHVEQALANMRYDVAAEQIVQPPASHTRSGRTAERLVTCKRFLIDRIRFDADQPPKLPRGELAVWIVLSGGGALVCDADHCDLRPGDVVLVPAQFTGGSARVQEAGELLDVRIPTSAATAGGAPR